MSEELKYDFSGIPARAIGDDRLSATHWRALTAVSYYDRFYRNRLGCLVSQTKLADQTRMTRETLNRRLQDLMEWGYIEIVRGGQGRAAELRVLHDVTDSSQAKESGCDQPVTSEPSTCDAEDHTKDIPLRGFKKFSQTEPSGSRGGVPYDEIVRIYHELLPNNPPMKGWTKKRRQAVDALWRSDEKRQELDYWRRFFTFIAEECPFLIGKIAGERGPFHASFDWLTSEDKFYPVIEGQYKQAMPKVRKRKVLGEDDPLKEIMETAI